MFKKPPVFLNNIVLFFLLISPSLVYGSSEYDPDKPQSKQIFVVDLNSEHYGEAPKKTWSNDEKGKYAEKIIEDMFHAIGFRDCPAKYISVGRPDATGRRYSHPEQGIDGLFLKTRRDQLPLMLVNESKFQWKGGSPKLSSMGCAECSGGVGDTDQMSWRWIHHSVESVVTGGKGYCKVSDRFCSSYCRSVIALLREHALESLVLRTATVVNEDSSVHFYALYSNDAEFEKVKTVLIDVCKLLKALGYRTRYAR